MDYTKVRSDWILRWYPRLEHMDTVSFHEVALLMEAHTEGRLSVKEMDSFLVHRAMFGRML